MADSSTSTATNAWVQASTSDTGDFVLTNEDSIREIVWAVDSTTSIDASIRGTPLPPYGVMSRGSSFTGYIFVKKRNVGGGPIEIQIIE